MNWRHFTLTQRDGHSAYMALFCNCHPKMPALYRKKSSPCFRIRNTSARRTSLVPRQKEGKRRGIPPPGTPISAVTTYVCPVAVRGAVVPWWPGADGDVSRLSSAPAGTFASCKRDQAEHPGET